MYKKKSEENLKREAQLMILSKEIPTEKLEIINSLMKDKNLDPEDRYSRVIDILQKFPNKSNSKQIKKNGKTNNNSQIPYNKPTETTLYINDIYVKYKHLKIFKKRYLVHKNNKFGIGIKKRLIPSKKLLTIFKKISVVQIELTEYFPEILLNILNDPNIEDPTNFNYIRIIRRWLLNIPFAGVKYDSIKWMERINFEKEFNFYIMNYFSFLKLKSEEREKIIISIENGLRSIDKFKRYKIEKNDTDSLKREKDKSNLAKEKIINNYLNSLRSMLPMNHKEYNKISNILNNIYNIRNLTDLLLIIAEALIFQRPFDFNELVSYFNIGNPKIDSVIWDYNQDLVKKAGKDKITLSKKELDLLNKKLIPYEFLNFFINYKINEKQYLIYLAEENWEIMTRRHQNGELISNENFFMFLESIMSYFYYTYIPVLNGSEIIFNIQNKEKYRNSIFTNLYFKDEIIKFKEIYQEIRFYKSKNFNNTISKDEIGKIVSGNIKSMININKFLLNIGNLFYKIGKKLHLIYDSHRLWVLNGSNLINESYLLNSIGEKSLKEIDESRGIPLAFFNATIEEVMTKNPLSSLLSGEKILEDSLKEGVFVKIIAASYQIAFECRNEKLYADLDMRKNIIDKINKLSNL